MACTFDLYQLGPLHVRHEPGHRLTVVLLAGNSTTAEENRHVQSSDVERCRSPDAREIGHQSRAVVASVLSGSFGQPVPGGVSHHPAEEALGFDCRVRVQRGPSAGHVRLGSFGA